MQEGSYKLEKAIFYFAFADQPAEFGADLNDAKLQELLGVGTVSVRQIVLPQSELDVASVDIYIAVGGSVTVVVLSGPGVIWAAW